MKWLFILAGIPIGILLIIAMIGYFLPVGHTATVKVPVNAPPDKVWQRLTDFKDYPLWRSDVKTIEILSDHEWVEVNQHNRKLPLKIISKEPVSKLLVQVNGTGLPFGGNFEFLLHPEGDKTLVTITENGEIYNPVFRFAARFIIGYSATAKKYGSYLQQSFH